MPKLTFPWLVPDNSPWRAVRRNLGWLLASRSLLAVLSLIYLAIAARSLGVVGFGRFALITAAAQVIAGIVAFQTWQVIVQFGVGPLERGDDAALARLFRGGVMLDLAGAVVGVALAAVVLTLFAEQLGIGVTLRRATLIFTAVQILSVRSAILGMMRLRGGFGAAAAADAVTPCVRLIGAGAVAYLHPTLQGFLFAWGAAEVVTAGAYWIMAARAGDLALLRKGRGVGRLADEHPGLIRFAWSTNVNATLGQSAKQLPLLLTGALLSPAAAGVFRLAAQLGQGLAKLSQLLSRAAYPEMVKLLANADGEVIRGMLRRLIVASAIGAGLILVVTALLGRPVLLLVGGEQFATAWHVLPWIALAASVDLASTGLETMLTALRRAPTVLLARLTGLILLCIGAATLAPTYGATGIAAALAIGSVIAALAMCFATARLAVFPGRVEVIDAPVSPAP